MKSTLKLFLSLQFLLECFPIIARHSPLFWRDSIKILELNYQQYPSSNQIKIVCSKTLRFYLTDFIVYCLLIKIFLTWFQNHASQSLIIKCLTSLRLEANWNSMLQKMIFLDVFAEFFLTDPKVVLWFFLIGNIENYVQSSLKHFYPLRGHVITILNASNKKDYDPSERQYWYSEVKYRSSAFLTTIYISNKN